MNRRLHGLTLALALLGIVAVGGIASHGVFAQDATPSPSTGPSTQQTPRRSAFLDAFAAQLGVTDQAQIDAAVQAAIGQVLDQKVAAGELTQAQADAIKARVAAGDYRIGLRVGGMEGGFRGGMDGRGHHRHGRGDAPKDRDKDGSTITPPASPAAGTAAPSI